MFLKARRVGAFFAISALIFMAWTLFSAPAFANVERRVALVVGNGAYKSVPGLGNSVYDARAVAQSLRDLGFEVTDGYDLDTTGLRTLLGTFVATLPDSTAAVVYYAGHGVSVDEENYLLPTDIVLKSAADLEINALSVSLILKQLKRDERANIVILDACRNNPFAALLKRSKTRSLVQERGLSAIDSNLARGAMIAFASDPKSAAFDGKEGEHSPFTKALLAHLKDADAPIETVMTRVRSDVWAATNNQQLPWVNTSLIGEFQLTEKAPAPATQAPTVTAAAVPPAAGEGLGERRKLEAELWESAQHSNLGGDYQAYLEAFPSGTFAKMAHNRIAAFGDKKAIEPIPQPGPIALPSPSAEALRGEVGTDDTEKTLKLDGNANVEIYRRLAILKFNVGAPVWVLKDPARAAIRDWQRSHAVAVTGYLGPLQLAALKAETEADYQAPREIAPVSKPRPAARPRSYEYHAERNYAPRRRHRSESYGPGPSGDVMGQFFFGLGHGFGDGFMRH